MIHTIDQQPVRLDMTFSETGIVTREIVVSVSFRERFFLGKHIDHTFRQFKVTPSFCGELQFAPETIGKYDLRISALKF